MPAYDLLREGQPDRRDVSTVAALYRYPVKSMQGEQVERANITDRGVDGDRAFALVDVATQQIASSHHPDKWGQLLQCRARWHGGSVAVTLPDGTTVTTDSTGEERLSQYCGRQVRFIRDAPQDARYELVVADVPDSWPAGALAQLLGDTAPAAGRIAKLGVGLAAPAGSLVDLAPVHVLTAASLAALAAVGGDTDVRRFRPNIVVDNGAGAGFTESDWTGRTLRIGSVELSVTMPTMRCLVPTLAQHGLDRHRDTLVALAKHNRVEFASERWACLGSYASVTAGGTITVGDDLTLA
jgi:uncharacterized protein